MRASAHDKLISQRHCHGIFSAGKVWHAFGIQATPGQFGNRLADNIYKGVDTKLAMVNSDRRSEREVMLREQLMARGICDQRVLAAMACVPRHLFVPPSVANRAYEDSALPVDCDQTISQPYIVAYMSALLMSCSPERVLEIGTGTGYQTAILANLCAEVFTIEWHVELSRQASERLNSLGIKNVHLRVGDGRLGWPDESPFEGILVAAASSKIPDLLLAQLAVKGVLVAPIGDPSEQLMTVIRRGERGLTRESTIGCRFVPLLDSHRRKVRDRYP